MRRRAITEAFIVSVFVFFCFLCARKRVKVFQEQKMEELRRGIKKPAREKNRRGKREVKA